MLESMLSLTLNEVQWSQFAVTTPSRPMFGPVETADGYVMVAIASEKTFQSLVTAAGHPEWIGDPRFAKYPDRRDNWKDLMEGVETWSRPLSTENMPCALNQNGVPSSAYRTVAQALSDPQLAHRGALAEVDDDGGTFKVMNLPFRMSGAAVSRGKARGNARRTHRRLSPREWALGSRDRGLYRQRAVSRREAESQ